jgi:hypothetical protein
MELESLREKTLIDLFSAFEGIYGPSFECKYYPCHFAGQDCTLCYCPFYPCLIYDMGGELKVTSDGRFVWSCTNCWVVHEKDFSETVIFSLSRYPRQKLIEEDWFFFNEILQELVYGDVLALFDEGNYNLMEAILFDKFCEEIEEAEALAVKVEDFSIKSVRKVKSVEEADKEILIPVKDRRRYYGIKNGCYVVCEAERVPL